MYICIYAHGASVCDEIIVGIQIEHVKNLPANANRKGHFIMRQNDILTLRNRE